MIKIKFMTLFLTLFTGFSQASSIDSTITMCNDCHGAKGVSSDSDIPSIAGFSETTISDMLIAYIDETRSARSSKYRHGDTSRSETNMYAIAKELSEENIEAIASYYSEQIFIPSKQTFDSALAKKGEKLHEERCIICHEQGGSSADDDASILAGQWMPFLEQAFKDYRSGERETEEGMKKKIDRLSEKQIKALIHYYASQQ
ncbi:c-type cytochrome [Thalassotalea sp. ND16A]|uniref:c-type cytochrome n=1 Tax=Thalassotalea sp. ND16A TaxID=1535422 RepID=UPI000519F59E|nr:c-type cytochrome [Thalassotalea sp. ND16A]KGJ98428.1 hypothetical protein ND16A_0737 [Thalassotalea sp. ND16A]